MTLTDILPEPSSLARSAPTINMTYSQGMTKSTRSLQALKTMHVPHELTVQGRLQELDTRDNFNVTTAPYTTN